MEMENYSKKSTKYSEVENDEEVEEIISQGIQQGEGLIAYRKYIWALKFLEEKTAQLKEYRRQVVDDIDKEITKRDGKIQDLRNYILNIMEIDKSVPTTKTGGKSLKLPDIATVSLSKSQEKIKITDPNIVLEQLGEEYKKVTVSLDVTKAKKYIINSDKNIKGAEKYQDKVLTINYTRD